METEVPACSSSCPVALCKLSSCLLVAPAETILVGKSSKASRLLTKRVCVVQGSMLGEWKDQSANTRVILQRLFEDIFGDKEQLVRF